MASRVTCKWPSVKSASERVAVHGVPVGVGGQADGAVGQAAAAAATEKTAGVAGHLVAADGNVLEYLLLDDVVVLVEGGDGEFGQHVVHESFLTRRQQHRRPLDPGRLLPKERKNGQNNTFLFIILIEFNDFLGLFPSSI